MEEIECPVCGKSHSIKDCEEFLKLGNEERKWYLKRNNVMGVTKKSQECIMQNIAQTEQFVRCVMTSIQQHCMDWFWEKINQKIRMY